MLHYLDLQQQLQNFALKVVKATGKFTPMHMKSWINLITCKCTEATASYNKQSQIILQIAWAISKFSYDKQNTTATQPENDDTMNFIRWSQSILPQIVQGNSNESPDIFGD